MDQLAGANAVPATPTKPLTPQQQQALKRLDNAAQQLEGVFLGMLFKEMHKTVDQSASIFGKPSNADDTWNEMLDEQRAEALAKTGTVGIAKVIEQQLRATVLGSAGSGSGQSSAGSPALPSLDTPGILPEDDLNAVGL